MGQFGIGVHWNWKHRTQSGGSVSKLVAFTINYEWVVDSECHKLPHFALNPKQTIYTLGLHDMGKARCDIHITIFSCDMRDISLSGKI